MRLLRAAWLLALAPLPVLAQSEGKVLRLASAPFPHASRSYRDDRVLAYVTPGVAGPEVDVIVHYHGHRTPDAIADARARKLPQQLRDSGKAALLLAPAGPVGANDSSGGKHDEPGGLKRFLDEAFAAAAREGLLPAGARPGRVVLSGFSGGGRVIAFALRQGGVPVQEVWLHDALYGQFDAYSRWARAPGRRLVSTHTPGGGTRGHNQSMAAELRAAGIPVAGDPGDPGAHAVFMAVPEGHQAVTGRFGAIARGSRLRARQASPAPAQPTRGIVDQLR